MMAPRYRDIKSSDVPEVTTGSGATIKVICGSVEGKRGPVTGIVIDPEYLDVAVPPDTDFTHATKPGHTVFAYVIGGKGIFCNEKNPFSYEALGENYFDMERDAYIRDGTAVLFGDGDQVTVTTRGEPVRFLLVSGQPIKEPVAWYGPIVMNTEEELEEAFYDYRAGTFIRSGPKG
jgi:redox-sensitive bicupin YhaK (pirin superfamily)